MLSITESGRMFYFNSLLLTNHQYQRGAENIEQGSEKQAKGELRKTLSKGNRREPKNICALNSLIQQSDAARRGNNVPLMLVTCNTESVAKDSTRSQH